MSGTGEVDERGPGGGRGTLLALPANYVMSAIGSVVSIGGFVALVTTNSVKSWVKGHPYPIYLALIAAVLVIAGTMDYAYHLRRRLTQPSRHDKTLYGAVVRELPADGTVIDWLKRADMSTPGVENFPADVLGALERTAEFSRTRSVGFDDPRIAGSFASLTRAIVNFCQALDQWTLTAEGHQSGPATAESPTLPRCHHELVAAYDRFIRTAHTRGIDIDG